MNRNERKWNFPKLRNSFSYFIYITGLNPLGFFSVFLDFLFLGASLYLYFNDLGTSSWILMGIATIALIWDFVQFVIRWRESRTIRLSEILFYEFPYDQIQPGPLERSNNYVMEVIPGEQECALYSKDINRNLQTHEVDYILSNRKQKKIRRYFKHNLIQQKAFLKKNVIDSNKNNNLFYNGSQLCLSSNLTIENTSENTQERIICHKGGYFDSYLTNIVNIRKIVSKDDDVLADGSNFQCYYRDDECNYLTRELSEMINNGEIGVSTLGFSKDKHFIQALMFNAPDKPLSKRI